MYQEMRKDRRRYAVTEEITGRIQNSTNTVLVVYLGKMI
jgi:hypothetical protein